VKRKTTHMKLKGAGLALTLALLAPAAAHAASAGDEGTGKVKTVVTVPSSSPPRLANLGAADGRVLEQKVVAATKQGGLGWHEAAVGAAILLGILLLGLWGDVVVGSAIVGAAALLGAAGTLAARTPRGDRARSATGRRTRRSDGRLGAPWPPAPGDTRR